jgi:type IV pilus assembly protein PilB
MKKKRLGEVLHERGHVSGEALNKALQDQRGKVIHLGELLLQQGSVSKVDLVRALGEVTTVPYVDCAEAQVPADILGLVPATMARRYDVLPLGLESDELIVAMSEPRNLEAIDQLRFKSGMKIVPRLAFHLELRDLIARHYGWIESSVVSTTQAPHRAEVAESMEFISSSEQQRNVEAMREIQAERLQKSKTTPAVQLAASMIQAAVQRSASDIHVEPQSGETSVRLRVDGILKEFERIPKALQNSVHRESKSFPIWTFPSGERRRTAGSS